MHKFYLAYGLVLGTLCSLSAQSFLGYHSSNYGGLSTMSVNPANIVDNRFLFEMNLLSGDFRISNNYLGIGTKVFNANMDINPADDSIYIDNFQGFRDDWFKEKDLKKQARIYESLHLQGPSFAFQIGKNAFAITSDVRQCFFIDNLEPRTASFILDELENPSLWNIDLDNKKFNTVATAWSEFGVAYGREIWSNGEHFVKGALQLKFMVAMFNAYFYADELMLNFKNADTLRVHLSDIRFGYSNNLSDDILGETFGSVQNFFNKTTVGANVGFVYEWRPKHKDFLKGDDSGKYVRHKNKYLLKAGVSVNDIGSLRFDRGTWAGGFEGITLDWDLDTFAASLEGIETFGKLMRDSFQMTENRDPYNLRLPTNLSFFVDYNIWKGLYVNFTGLVGFSHNNSPQMLHALNQFTITPRYEHTWFDVGIPVAVNGHNNVTVGTSLRLGPLFIGSADCWNFILGKNVRGLNVYGGLKMFIPYTKGKKKKQPDIMLPDPPKEDTIAIIEPDTTAIITEANPQPDTPKTQVVIDTSVADPNPVVDFPEPEIFQRFTDTVNLKNGSTPVSEEDRIATRELIRRNKTYRYLPNIFEFDPFQMQLAKGSVYFETGEYKVQSADKPVLDEIAKILKINPKLRIEIHGHADNVGDIETNKELSAKRAESVKKYLISKGAPAEQIVKIDAFGSDNPIADNESEEGRQKNRRVELILASDGGF